MKELHVISFIVILLVGTISAAYADCYKDGRAYPTGTVINGYKCTVDGKWVRQ